MGSKDFIALVRAEENFLRFLQVVKGYKNSELGGGKIQKFAGVI